MSSRRTPEELSDQLNQLEEQFRRLVAELVTTPTDVRLLYDARGDILVGGGDNLPQRLGRGSDGDVLTSRAAEALGLAWEAINALQASLLTDVGALIVGESTGVGASLPVGADGDVLTASSGSPLGVEWASSAESDAEVLAWMAMAMVA